MIKENYKSDFEMEQESVESVVSVRISRDREKFQLDQVEEVKERTKFPATQVEKDAIYEGEWLLGKRDGFGRIIWSDGSSYEG